MGERIEEGRRRKEGHFPVVMKNGYWAVRRYYPRTYVDVAFLGHSPIKKEVS